MSNTHRSAAPALTVPFSSHCPPDGTWFRCSVCEKLTDVGAPDADGRCPVCSAGDAREVACECGYLYAHEACACGAAREAA